MKKKTIACLMVILGCDAAVASIIGQWYLNGDATAQVGNDGSLQNNASTDPVATTGQQGNPGGALEFNGNNYVLLPDAGGLNGLTTGSISLFARWTGTQTGPTFDIYGTAFARQSDGFFSDFVLGLSGDDPDTAILTYHPNNGGGGIHSFGNFQAGDGIAGSGTSPLDGQWRHIALTFDGPNHRVYLDGNLEMDVTVGGGFNNNPNVGLSVGAFVDVNPTNGSNGYYNGIDGDIDFVTFYDHELSQGEVSALFAAGADGAGTAVPEASSMALFGLGALGLAFHRRRKRTPAA